MGLMSTPGLDAALERIGDRWSLLIVDALIAGPQRFGELAEALPIAPNVLTARLRRLERAGLVHSRPYQRRPLRVEYALSETGQTLADALALLAGWGAALEGATDPHGAPTHDLCGTPLELVWWCPTCERMVGRDDAAGELHHF